jgi:8-hydroxy-5-deazaflavin:NADPH oxidoreductase
MELVLMKIAIIGTGNVGRALAGSFVRAGHQVTLSARDAAKTRTVASEIGVSASGSPSEAVDWADIVVLAVPYVSSGRAVASAIAPVVGGKIVIDATNPAKSDYSGLATGGDSSAAEQFAAWLPGARVVKAFNTVFASIQADPLALGTTVDAFYATDDERARTTVAELISSIDLRPVDAGPLARARELEALAWLNIQIQMTHGGDWRSAYALVGAPEGATRAPADLAA